MVSQRLLMILFGVLWGDRLKAESTGDSRRPETANSDTGHFALRVRASAGDSRGPEASHRVKQMPRETAADRNRNTPYITDNAG